MSAWRRKAVALFPRQAEYLARPDATLGRLFLELVTNDVVEAHARYAADDTDAEAALTLRRIHGYTEWCLHHEALGDEAGIGFYEGLFTVVPWEQIAPWLSPFVVSELRKTYALGRHEQGWPKLASLLDGRSDHAYRTTVFATSEIERL